MFKRVYAPGFTLGKSFTVESKAVTDTSVTVKMTVLPHSTQKKITVLEDGQRHELEVCAENLINPNYGRHTSYISQNGITVCYVEHILSALHGMGIDCFEILLEGGREIPFPDGSARTFCQKIGESGRTKLEVLQPRYVVTENIYFHKDDSYAILRPNKSPVWAALIQFEAPIGEQYAVSEEAFYVNNIAYARTFIRTGVDEEIWKQKRTILPILPEDMKKSPTLVFDTNHQWVVAPEMKNEPCLHKILDVIGDTSVFGRIIGHVTLIRPGHEFNRDFVQFLRTVPVEEGDTHV